MSDLVFMELRTWHNLIVVHNPASGDKRYSSISITGNVMVVFSCKRVPDKVPYHVCNCISIISYNFVITSSY